MEAHKRDANHALQVTDPTQLDDAGYMLYAQVEATLALVEQQRIANLIALETLASNMGGAVDENSMLLDRSELGTAYNFKPEIKNALEV